MSATVITGLAAAAPNGVGTDAYWDATLRGESGIDRISRYDTRRYPVSLAGEINDLDPVEHLPSRILAQTDRITRVALIASDWVLEDARINPEQLTDFAAGVVVASSAGGHEFGQQQLQKLWQSGSDHVSAYQSFAWFYAVNTGQISIRHGLQGACGVLVAEQAGGLDAITKARRNVRAGSEVVITGGLDSALCPWGLVAQLPNGRLSESVDPAGAYLPFDERAAGYVPGEGGALLVVEPVERARNRHCPAIYGAILGCAATFDPAPGRNRPPGLRRAIELALADAELAPDAVDVVFADGAAVSELDQQEAAAIEAVFGPDGVPVTVPKSMTGRLASGGGALDVLAALLSMRDDIVPPTINTGRMAPGIHLDLVTEARTGPVRHTLVLARGYGGFNSAILLGPPPD